MRETLYFDLKEVYFVEESFKINNKQGAKKVHKKGTKRTQKVLSFYRH